MPISHYGVWSALPVHVDPETAEEDDVSPHIHLFYDDGSGRRRASINVKSLSEISELVFWHVPDFRHPVTDMLGGLPPGFHPLPSRPGGVALDYLRGNLVDFSRGRLLPHDIAGDGNDLIDFIMPELQAAINRNAQVYLFGEPYSDHQGIHDIHMNQGSAGRFASSNGVWQDGGILIDYAQENRFAAIFLAFGSQAIHTDETTGDALPGSQNFKTFLSGGTAPVAPVPPDEGGEVIIAEDRRVAIVAARVNPEGPENTAMHQGLPEVVCLFNRSDRALSLSGWRVLNKADEAHEIGADHLLMPGEMRHIPVAVPLSNRGGVISLLDAEGLKVDGVSYTGAEASAEGEMVLFRG